MSEKLIKLREEAFNLGIINDFTPTYTEDDERLEIEQLERLIAKVKASSK